MRVTCPAYIYVRSGSLSPTHYVRITKYIDTYRHAVYNISLYLNILINKSIGKAESLLSKWRSFAWRRDCGTCIMIVMTENANEPWLGHSNINIQGKLLNQKNSLQNGFMSQLRSVKSNGSHWCRTPVWMLNSFSISHKSVARISGFVIIHTETQKRNISTLADVFHSQAEGTTRNSAFYQRGVSSKEKLIRGPVISYEKQAVGVSGIRKAPLRPACRVPYIIGVCSQDSERLWLNL